MLKIANGGKSRQIFRTNNFVGMQICEFDSEVGTDKEQAQMEAARQHFYQKCFKHKECGDGFWQFQVLNILTKTSLFSYTIIIHSR